MVSTGSVGTINMGNRFNLNGSVTGSGTLNLNVQTAISRDNLSSAFSAFAGVVNFLGSGGVQLTFNGGSFDGFDAATVNRGSAINLLPVTSSTGNTIDIGELNGAGNLYGGTAGMAGSV